MSTASIVPGRGVVQQVLAEYEVIGPGNFLYSDQMGQWLFTQARATIIARAIRGKMWLMPHTPDKSPARAFGSAQRVLFTQARCPYIVRPDLAGWSKYCGEPTAPRADYGHCAEHKGQLLTARFYARNARKDVHEHAGMLPCLHACAGNFVIPCSASGGRPFRYSYAQERISRVSESMTGRVVPEDKAELYRQQAEAGARWNDISRLAPAERQKAADAWGEEYGHLFYWCCGTPVFGGADAEKYYESSDSWKRGDHSGGVAWYA